MRRDKISIKWRLFGYLLFFTVIILTILWLCQVIFLEDLYKLVKINEIERSAKSLTQKIDSLSFETEAVKLAERSEVCILVLKMVDENTAVEVISIETLKNCAIHNTDKSSKFTLYDSALKNGGSLLQRFRYDESNRVFYSVNDNFFKKETAAQESIIFTTLATNRNGENMLIMVNSIISPVSAIVKTMFIIFVALALTLFIFALALAFVIAKRVSRPIENINKSAKILATRNYGVTFNEHGYKEIAELGETLNYAASELGKVDSLCRELIANISHDLRTPLTMITGYSEVMRDLPGENTPENIQIIIDEANRLTSLVNEVLDTAKFQEGAQELQCKPFCLTDSIKNALARYEKLTRQDGYDIRFHYDGSVMVNSDENRILQVIYNLVNNAVTHTGADKRIDVAQVVSDEWVRIEVTDTGEGIEPDKLDLIWERYYRVDKVHKRAAMGSGIGLSIVKSIMKLAGGHYGVISKPGFGSTFWVALPIESFESETA